MKSSIPGYQNIESGGFGGIQQRAVLVSGESSIGGRHCRVVSQVMPQSVRQVFIQKNLECLHGTS